MKKSTPISLFSFQDIITCLTGIMIVVVLIILLQLVESTRAAAAAAKLRPEYDTLYKIYKQLVEKKKNLTEKIVSNKEAADKYANDSVTDIKRLIQEEEAFSQVVGSKIAKAERNLSDLVRQNALRKQRSEELKKELHSLSKSENEIRELQAQLLALQRMKQNISTMIQRKSRMLRFEFSGFESQIPLLIECNSWGFRCKRYPDGAVETFGTPQKGTLARQLPALQTWIRENGVYNTYSVLLFRESALPFYKKIVMALFEVYKKICWGQELVGQHEEVF